MYVTVKDIINRIKSATPASPIDVYKQHDGMNWGLVACFGGTIKAPVRRETFKSEYIGTFDKTDSLLEVEKTLNQVRWGS